MTTLSELEARGEARGEARVQAALAEMLVKLLTLRFRTVPEEARAQLLGADVATLERWSNLAMTASSLEAVLAS